MKPHAVNDEGVLELMASRGEKPRGPAALDALLVGPGRGWSGFWPPLPHDVLSPR